MVKKNIMGIKEYFNDLMVHFETDEMSKKFIDNNFYYDKYRRSLKNTATCCNLSAIKHTDFSDQFLVLYITESDPDDEWHDLGYYFVFHKDKVELVEYNKDGLNLYETSDSQYLCNNKDEYFNLSVKFDLKLDFEFIQFIYEKFKVLKTESSKKYIIYYGIGEEVNYGYK